MTLESEYKDIMRQARKIAKSSHLKGAWKTQYFAVVEADYAASVERRKKTALRAEKVSFGHTVA